MSAVQPSDELVDAVAVVERLVLAESEDSASVTARRSTRWTPASWVSHGW
jgi:hypothetical protein